MAALKIKKYQELVAFAIGANGADEEESRSWTPSEKLNQVGSSEIRQQGIEKHWLVH